MQLGRHPFTLRGRVSQLVCSSIIVLCVSRIATSQGLPLAEPQEVGMSAAGLANVTGTFKRLIENKEVAGAVAIVARRGKVVYFEAQGLQDIAAGTPMARDSIFRIYSMTKAVVSVAAMILVEEGRLELDTPAANYIPALGTMRVGGKPQERSMTLRDLLRHTAGFPNNVTTDRTLKRGGVSRACQEHSRGVDESARCRTTALSPRKGLALQLCQRRGGAADRSRLWSGC